MKSKRKITLVSLIAAFIMVSCAQFPDLSAEFEVERPESFAFRNYLASYGPLKSYIDRAQNPNFKLGAATNVPDFVDGGVVYRLLVSNFDQVTLENAMTHESVVSAEGVVNTGPIAIFMDAAERAGISVYGHPLVWHNRQRASWLNSQIAPIIRPGEPGHIVATEMIENGDFATDNLHSFEVRGDGGAQIVEVPGRGRVWRLPSPTRTVNVWGREFFFRNFDPRARPGDVLVFSMDIRAASTPAYAINVQTHSTPGNAPHIGAGQIHPTTEWQTVEMRIPIGENRVGNTPGVSTICFHIGWVETTLYIDNVSVLLEVYVPGTFTSIEQVTNGDFAAGGSLGNFEFRRPAAEGGNVVGDANAALIVNDPVKGRAWRLPSPTRTDNPWGREFFFRNLSTPGPAQVGDALILSMDIRSDLPTGQDGRAAIAMQTHSTPGTAPHQAVQNINATPEWQTIEIRVPITEARVGTTAGVSALAFHIGHIETTLYIANVSVIREVPGEIIIRTPEEKIEIITAELGTWIRTMLEVAPDIRRWNIVNDPISNTAPFGVRPVPADPGANQFFWQEFLGDAFAATAIKFARQYGRPDIQLFINDYGLEGDGLDKLNGLLAFIDYTESLGVTVDGIGTKMHISLDTPRQNIVDKFQRLAATGKLIQVTELSISLGLSPVITIPMATPELLREQADLYRFVVEQYFAIIPAAQRAGITFWTPLDSTDQPNTPDTPGVPTFRRNQPVGLWSASITQNPRTNVLRKHAYAGVVNGLQGRPLTPDEVIESNF